MTYYIAQWKIEGENHFTRFNLNSFFYDESGMEFNTELEAVEAITQKIEQMGQNLPECKFRIIRYEDRIIQQFDNERDIEWYYEDHS